ncbi:MAG: putative phosphoribosyltransferase [Haloquadratum walsbyi J07HQW1]|uniref:Putative phosphoribosyltransferase n=1 Tax=Haloquadratum walsbyi J07HQW1 TaxID=1238424 RepID=U1PB09_9EURY|nr:MAG: putative phosphoribosyltransferase [Haloquadratum walsbyi J07HQW1]
MVELDQFDNRVDAGKQLGAMLRTHDMDADMTLAIPRGGLPLGRTVADTLSTPVDIIVAKKIAAPKNAEYAIGAVASDGSVWRNDTAIRQTSASETYFEREREAIAEQAEQKAIRYRESDDFPDLTDSDVIIVDDGAATGATIRACLNRMKKINTASVTVALPVVPPDTIKMLEQSADSVMCLKSPQQFRGVGQFYETFEQVSDTEAMSYLA